MEFLQNIVLRSISLKIHNFYKTLNNKKIATNNPILAKQKLFINTLTTYINVYNSKKIFMNFNVIWWFLDQFSWNASD